MKPSPRIGSWFLWLPSAPGDSAAESPWAGTGRAAGVAQARWSDTLPSVDSSQRGTQGVRNAAMDGPTRADTAGHGAMPALQRSPTCHGAGGVGHTHAPNLAGRYPEVIIKQLADYRHGDRLPSITRAMAEARGKAGAVSRAAAGR